MKRNRLLLNAAVTSAVALFGARVANAQEGYTLDVTTFYQFGAPDDLTYSDFGTGSPDTGYWSVQNNGSSTFNGSIGQVAVSNFGGDVSYSHNVSLAPGAKVTFAVNTESSNVGGFNGPTGSTQPGVQIVLNGLINGIEAVNLSVNDADIHSGVPRINPFGLTVDSYVLQGGEPLGRDTGDGFETTQDPGHFRFFEAAAVGAPDGGATLALMSLALTGIIPAARRMRK